MRPPSPSTIGGAGSCPLYGLFTATLGAPQHRGSEAEGEWDEEDEADEADEWSEEDDNEVDGAKEEADGIDTELLSRQQVEYVEAQYGLPGIGTFDERGKAVVRALRAKSAELRKQHNGKISKDAVDRSRMQAAWARIGMYTTTDGQWRRRFFYSERVGWYEAVHDSNSLADWHIKQLLAGHRVGAAGGSQIGAKRTLQAHKDLRGRQGFEDAFGWFKASAGGFGSWSVIEFERMLLWGAAEHRIAEWGGAQEGSLLWRIATGAACYYGEKYMLALLYGGTPTPQQDGEHALYHKLARHEVAEVSGQLFDSNGGLNGVLVPPGTELYYEAFRPDSTGISFRIYNLGSLVRASPYSHASTRAPTYRPRTSLPCRPSRAHQVPARFVTGRRLDHSTPRRQRPLWSPRACHCAVRAPGAVNASRPGAG